MADSCGHKLFIISLQIWHGIRVKNRSAICDPFCNIALDAHLFRTWARYTSVRVCNTKNEDSRIQFSTVPFPDELYYYGLNEKLLAKVFHYVQAQKKGSLPWSVRGVPSMLFYQQLHRYMKKWPLSSSIAVLYNFVLDLTFT